MFVDLITTVQEKWPVLVAAAALAYAAITVRAYLRLRHIPGPFWNGFSEFSHTRAFLSENCYEWYTSLSDTYGKSERRARFRQSRAGRHVHTMRIGSRRLKTDHPHELQAPLFA